MPGTERHHFGDDRHGPVSNTLEYAYDDWNVAQMAQALGKQDDYERFLQRSTTGKTCSTRRRLLQPRLSSGEWYEPSKLKNPAGPTRSGTDSSRATPGSTPGSCPTT